jgi:hypothetical protein
MANSVVAGMKSVDENTRHEPHDLASTHSVLDGVIDHSGKCLIAVDHATVVSQ